MKTPEAAALVQKYREITAQLNGIPVEATTSQFNIAPRTAKRSKRKSNNPMTF